MFISYYCLKILLINSTLRIPYPADPSLSFLVDKEFQCLRAHNDKLLYDLNHVLLNTLPTVGTVRYIFSLVVNSN